MSLVDCLLPRAKCLVSAAINPVVQGGRAGGNMYESAIKTLVLFHFWPKKNFSFQGKSREDLQEMAVNNLYLQLGEVFTFITSPLLAVSLVIISIAAVFFGPDAKINEKALNEYALLCEMALLMQPFTLVQMIKKKEKAFAQHKHFFVSCVFMDIPFSGKVKGKEL